MSNPQTLTLFKVSRQHELAKAKMTKDDRGDSRQDGAHSDDCQLRGDNPPLGLTV